MEQLSGHSGNAAAFVLSEKPGPVASDGLFIVDTQGQKPAFKQRSAPMVRSPSPSGSASSDEEVIFAGRRPQANPVAVSAPREVYVACFHIRRFPGIEYPADAQECSAC